MILRSATLDDAPEIAAVDRALFAVDAWSLPFVVGQISGRGSFAVVAVSDGELLGYAMTMRADEVVDLQRIGVLPSQQRKGLGRRMLAAAMDKAVSDGRHQMMLEVSSTNQVALAFYAAEGFVGMDQRRRYYRDGSDALVLSRSLGRSLEGNAGSGGMGR